MRKRISKIVVFALIMSLVMSAPVVQADTEVTDTENAKTIEAVQPVAELMSEGTTGGVSENATEEKPASSEQPVDPASKYEQAKVDASKIPVLTYHMVVSDKQKKTKRYRRSSLAVSKSTFKKQMKYLDSKGYRTINCEELYLWHQGKLKLPKRSVLITFDDGAAGVAKYALPVLKKYDMKATVFIVGKRTYKNRKGSIKFAQMQQIQGTYPNMEFQSHTWGLHKKFKKKGDYEKCVKDANHQKEIFGFEYLAYPYGRNTAGMRAAYADTGIKLAFTYGKNGYADRSQNIYKIKRIKVNANQSFKKFTKWVK